MHAKNVTFPSSFLCNSLFKEKQKNSIVFYQIFAYVFSQNEEKTSETKNR